MLTVSIKSDRQPSACDPGIVSTVSRPVLTGRELHIARRRNHVLRVLGYGLCIAESIAIVGCVAWYFRTPGQWELFFCGLVVITALEYALAASVSRADIAEKHRVHEDGDSWTVGRYSEAQVRDAARQCIRLLPGKRREPRVVIGDCRCTGWTWFSPLWPGRGRRKTVWISAGALHYLEPCELQALIVHEVAHHEARNRRDVPGSGMLTSLTVFCLIVALLGPIGRLGRDQVFGVLLLVLFILRVALAYIHIRILFLLQHVLPRLGINLCGKAGRVIEHLCDLHAARYLGREATVNMLLKIAEEDELTEVVLARAARELSDVRYVNLRDLVLAFEEVRPYGRIFHDNLFRHAGQVVAQAAGDLAAKTVDARSKGKPDTSFARFPAERRKARQQRIRWRSFDRDGDGRLTDREIAELCAVLREHPERALFLCESERNPTTHPSFRDRILLLFESVTQPK